MVLGALALRLRRLRHLAGDRRDLRHPGQGQRAKGIAGRLAGALSGLIHLGLAFSAVKLALGGGSGGDFSESAESGAARR